jgi:hypothetical protein
MHPIPTLPPDLALLVANERLEGYRTEANNFRLAAAARSTRERFDGIRAALASARSALTVVDDTVRPGLPKLVDYPYRP